MPQTSSSSWSRLWRYKQASYLHKIDGSSLSLLVSPPFYLIFNHVSANISREINFVNRLLLAFCLKSRSLSKLLRFSRRWTCSNLAERFDWVLKRERVALDRPRLAHVELTIINFYPVRSFYVYYCVKVYILYIVLPGQKRSKRAWY